MADWGGGFTSPQPLPNPKLSREPQKILGLFRTSLLHFGFESTDKSVIWKSKTEKYDEVCKLANRNPTERNSNVNHSKSAYNLTSSSFGVKDCRKCTLHRSKIFWFKFSLWRVRRRYAKRWGTPQSLHASGFLAWVVSNSLCNTRLLHSPERQITRFGHGYGLVT